MPLALVVTLACGSQTVNNTVAKTRQQATPRKRACSRRAPLANTVSQAPKRDCRNLAPTLHAAHNADKAEPVVRARHPSRKVHERKYVFWLLSHTHQATTHATHVPHVQVRLRGRSTTRARTGAQ